MLITFMFNVNIYTLFQEIKLFQKRFSYLFSNGKYILEVTDMAKDEQRSVLLNAVAY